MKRELMRRWVRALRSGKYKQGHGYLCEVNRDGEEQFCCLGVLADIAVDGWWELASINGYYLIDGASGALTTDMRKEFGLTGQSKLIRMNDSGKSFEEIADYIEEHFEEL